MSIDLRRRSIYLFFLYGLIGMLAFPAIFSSFSIHYFAPAIIVALYRLRPIRALWFAFFSGLMLDLFDNSLKFGLQGLNHTLTAALLLRFRSYFFSDTLSTLPIMTALFCSFSSIFFIFFFNVSENAFTLFEWLFKISFINPLIEAALNFSLFCLPVIFFGRNRPSPSEYFAS